MKRKFFIVAAVMASMLSFNSAAQNESHIKFYGFIRNYAFVDSKESIGLTGDVFMYLPKDLEDNNYSYHFTAMTSRFGLDVSGYEYNGYKMGAKIETDFYNGLTGVSGTALLRLRQAYLTVAKDNFSLKVGQAWHPMAADMPDIIDLNTGAPFGPFSRTPLVQVDNKLNDNWSYTASLIWQMQYTSCGPEGSSANYVKYSGIPEVYFGINYTNGDFLARLGANEVTIKPINKGKFLNETSIFAFLQYKTDKLTLKAKSTFAQDGSHFNLNGGYALKNTSDFDAFDPTTWSFAPTTNSSTWVSFSYGKKVQFVLFGGYVKNFGVNDKVICKVAQNDTYYFSKNSFKNMNSMYRLSPQVIFNWGKLAFALEYENTSVQYGSLNTFDAEAGLYNTDLHWVTNHRFQSMLKFTF